MSLPFRDTIELGLRNLSQAILRTTLTVIGVVIGMAAIVSMVSFGLGLEELTSNQIAKLDLFTLVTVQGPAVDALMEQGQFASGGDGNSQFTKVLDDEGISNIRKIAGVEYVYPNLTFLSFARIDGHTTRVSVTGIPDEALSDAVFQQLRAGKMFAKGATDEVVVGPGFLRRARIRNAESAIGKTIVLLSRSSAPPEEGAEVRDSTAPQSPVGRGSLSEIRFTIVGVSEGFAPALGALGLADFRIPYAEAERLGRQNRDPLQELQESLTGRTGYALATLRVTDITRVTEVRDEIKKLGYRTQSITDGLDRIKNFFLILNVVLGLLGGISLVVAGFGIVNTLVMSILERTREIGIMKAIGAENGEVMRIFFVEASLIGLFGGVAGVGAGWLLGRVANLIANRWIVSQGGSAQQLFSVPLWLVFSAVGFAVFVSLVAGVYPALRAAQIDPIRSLRHD